MYAAFYGLSEIPFNLTPDPRYLFLSEQYRKAQRELHEGVEGRKGIIVFTGEVGTGKTTLLRALLDSLGPQTRTAFLFNPTLEVTDLLRAVLEDFGVPPRGSSAMELRGELVETLAAGSIAGMNHVLILDEAQGLDVAVLEEVRSLGEIAGPREKPLQIILSGQPELSAKLQKPQLRALRQRAGIRFHLSPLSAGEVREYVRHRLRVAGYDGPDLFDRAALDWIAVSSGGVPRLINVLCDNALLLGFALERRVIDEGMVREVLLDLEGKGTVQPVRRPRWWGARARSLVQGMRRPSPVALLGIALFVLLVLSWRSSVRPHRRGAGKPAARPVPEAPREPAREAAGGVAREGTVVGEPAVGESAETVPSTVEARPPAEIIVERGDFLLRIARRYYGRDDGVILRALREANPQITNPDLILVGERLLLPPAPPPVIPAAGP